MMYRMWWQRQIQRWLSGSRQPRRRSNAPRRTSFRPGLEQLETRLVPTTNTSSPIDANGLVNALQAAATGPSGDTNIINLQANTTYTLTQVNNSWYGPTGLPPIDSNVIIHGNGATIARDTNAGDNTPAFRLFYVSGGMELAPGSLTMDNVTLDGGLAKGGDSDQGGGGLGAGGAVFNQGTLALTAVTLANNDALGGSSGVGGSNSLSPINGGGGMGQDAGGLSSNSAAGNGDAGGFGDIALGLASSSIGGSGGRASGSLSGGGGGGGGFLTGTNGMPAANDVPGIGGGQGDFGGDNGSSSDGGGGGGGGSASNFGGNGGGSGGAFGKGGFGGSPAGGSGGGIGGGGGGVAVDENGGGGGGNGVAATADGGDGGFGGGGGGGGNNGISGNGGAGGFGAGAGAGGPLGQGSFGGFGGGSGFRTASGAGGGGGAGLGGAIFNMGGASNHAGSGQATLINCTLVSNVAQGGGATGGYSGSAYGAALFNLDGKATLTNDTLALNTVISPADTAGVVSAADGGAVYNLANGNDIDTGKPVTAALVLNNSILATSTGGNDLGAQAIDGAGTNTVTITGSTNLVMSNDGSPATGVILSTANPNLGTLAPNGGPTQTLLPPLPTADNMFLYQGTSNLSPATDQRGQLRPAAGPTELGSVQVPATPTPTPTPPPPTPTPTPPPTPTPVGNHSPAPTPTPPLASPLQLFLDGITLAMDLSGSGGVSAALANASLIHDIESASDGLFNPFLDAGFFAVLGNGNNS